MLENFMRDFSKLPVKKLNMVRSRVLFILFFILNTKNE